MWQNLRFNYLRSLAFSPSSKLADYHSPSLFCWLHGNPVNPLSSITTSPITDLIYSSYILVLYIHLIYSSYILILYMHPLNSSYIFILYIHLIYSSNVFIIYIHLKYSFYIIISENIYFQMVFRVVNGMYTFIRVILTYLSLKIYNGTFSSPKIRKYRSFSVCKGFQFLREWPAMNGSWTENEVL